MVSLLCRCKGDDTHRGMGGGTRRVKAAPAMATTLILTCRGMGYDKLSLTKGR